MTVSTFFDWIQGKLGMPLPMKLLLLGIVVVLSLLVAVGIRVGYRRAVARIMGRQGQELTSPPELPMSAHLRVAPAVPTHNEISNQARRSVWRLAVIEFAGGVVWAVVLVAWLEQELGLLVGLLVPAVQAALRVAGVSRTARWMIVLAVLIADLTLGWVLGVDLLGGWMKWLSLVVAPLLVAELVTVRGLRPFGALGFLQAPLVLAWVLGGVAVGTLVWLVVTGRTQPSPKAFASAFGVWALITVLVALPVPLLALSERVRVFSRNDLQQLMWWGAATCAAGAVLAVRFDQFVVVLLALTARGVVVAGLQWLLPDPKVNRRLLFLRVFEGERARPLFEDLAISWSRLGTLEFIAGTDLASAGASTQSVLSWLTGGLGDRAVRDDASLARRLQTLERPPDRDGTFRPVELRCADASWRGAMERLARRSDVVLMDLRGFQERHAGCIYELERLFRFQAPERVVLLVDDETDADLLHLTLKGLPTSSERPAQILKDPAPTSVVQVCAAAAGTRAPSDLQPAPKRRSLGRFLIGGALSLIPLVFIAGTLATAGAGGRQIIDFVRGIQAPVQAQLGVTLDEVGVEQVGQDLEAAGGGLVEDVQGLVVQD